MAALEADDARAAPSAADDAPSALRDAESFLEELAHRLHTLTREEMAAILRRAVPPVVVRQRENGLRGVNVTYRPAVITTNVY